VTITASGVPSGFTATLSPSSLPAGSAADNVGVTVQVPTTAMIERPGPPRRTLPFVALALLLPFVGRVRHSSKQLRRLAPVVLLLSSAGCLATLVGCSGGSGGTAAQPRNYSFTVTATSGALSHSTTLTVIVQ
jgi:hypothetical protein